MARQQLRNFELFDAPVGLFFTVHRSLAIGSKMDVSMMIQNVMLAAKPAVWTLARRLPGIIFTRSYLIWWVLQPMKSWSAVWHWAMPIQSRLLTALLLRAFP